MVDSHSSTERHGVNINDGNAHPQKGATKKWVRYRKMRKTAKFLVDEHNLPVSVDVGAEEGINTRKDENTVGAVSAPIDNAHVPKPGLVDIAMNIQLGSLSKMTQDLIDMANRRREIAMEGPIAKFFLSQQVPNVFKYEPKEESKHQFGRLWRERRVLGYEQMHLREVFQKAVTQEFSFAFGDDTDDLGAWKFMCLLLGISIREDVSLIEAREAVTNTHVNIYDFLENFRGTTRRQHPRSRYYGSTSENSLEIFPTEKELSEYTDEERRRFPLHTATAALLLRHLLRNIEDPPEEGRRRDAYNRLTWAPAAGDEVKGERGRRRRHRRKGKGEQSLQPTATEP